MKFLISVGNIMLFATCLAHTAQAEPIQWPANGHYYEFVRTNISWWDAKAAAAGTSYQGLSGHLATAISAAEDQFISASLTEANGEFAWLGGREPNDNGVWIWDAGPEAGMQFATNRIDPTAPFNF